MGWDPGLSKKQQQAEQQPYCCLLPECRHKIHSCLKWLHSWLLQHKVWSCFCRVYFFKLDIFFIYISNVIPFPGFPSKNLLSSPPPPTHQPSHSCFLVLAFPYRDPVLSLMISESIYLCICQVLEKPPPPSRRQLYQAPVSKHFLSSTIVSGFGDYMGWIPR